jgi:hypothetical protein
MPDHGAVLVTTEDHSAVLMTTEDGGLGLAVIQQSKLVLWSRETRLDSGKEDAQWAQSRVIELGALLPVNTLLYLRLLGGIVVDKYLYLLSWLSTDSNLLVLVAGEKKMLIEDKI